MQRAVTTANKALNQNPRLNELMQAHPELTSKAPLQDQGLDRLRGNVDYLRGLRDLLKEHIADHKRPGYVCMPADLHLLREKAASVELCRQALCKHMGVVVTADIKAKYA